MPDTATNVGTIERLASRLDELEARVENLGATLREMDDVRQSHEDREAADEGGDRFNRDWYLMERRHAVSADPREECLARLDCLERYLGLR